MDTRKLLTRVFTLVIAACLVTAVLYYHQAKHHESPSNTPTTTSSGKQPGLDQSPTTSTGLPPGDSQEGDKPGAQTGPDKKTLQAQIEQKYTERLQSTGASYEGRLNSLVASAVLDYQAAKEAGPNAGINSLARMYYNAGQALEAECDAKMYAILDEFENELRSHSFPIDSVNNARAAYDAGKSNRAAQLRSINP